MLHAMIFLVFGAYLSRGHSTLPWSYGIIAGP